MIRIPENPKIDHYFERLTYFTFSERINKETYLEFCYDIGLLRKVENIPSSIKCPGCGHDMKLATDRSSFGGKVYRCHHKKKKSKRVCERSVSLLHNTWFENSRLNMLTVLRLTLCFVYKAPLIETAYSTEISKQTAVDWYKCCREVCMIIIANTLKEIKIGGQGRIVEVEAHPCNQKYFKSRILWSKYDWIFTGLCRKTKDAFLVKVNVEKQSSLLSLILKYIDLDSIVVTNSDKIFQCLENEKYCAHYSVVHKKYFIDLKNQCVHTNNNGRLWKSMKSYDESLGSKMAESYLGQYLYFEKFFRKNGKIIRDMGFRLKTFLNHVKIVYPGPWAEGLRLPYAVFEEDENEPPKKIIKLSYNNNMNKRVSELKTLANTILENLLCENSYNSFEEASNIIISHKNEIEKMISLLRKATVQMYDIYKHDVEYGVESVIHPAFKQIFQAIAVNGNGDCFYLAVSICLFGNHSFVDLIRLCTIYYFLKYWTDLENISARIQMQQSMINILRGIGISNRLFLEASQYYKDMKYTDIWANSLSIFSCSIALGRPIYIYTDMRLTSGGFRNEACSPQELSDNFLGGFLQLAHDSFSSRTPVRVLLHNNHYSAILSCVPESYEFKPTNRSFASLNLDEIDINI